MFFALVKGRLSEDEVVGFTAAIVKDNNNTDDGVTLWLQILKKSPVGQMNASSQENGLYVNCEIGYSLVWFMGGSWTQFRGLRRAVPGLYSQKLADSRRRWLSNLAGAAA